MGLIGGGLKGSSVGTGAEASGTLGLKQQLSSKQGEGQGSQQALQRGKQGAQGAQEGAQHARRSGQ